MNGMLRLCLRCGGLVLLVFVFVAIAAPSAHPQARGGRGQGRGVPDPPQRPMPTRDATAAQPIPAGTATVAGMVLVPGTGQPARRARVTLNATEGGGMRTATTDEHGQFAFEGLPAGRYNLSASKAGHVGVTYGQTYPGRPGTPIQLGDGQKFSANLHLPRGSVVTGTVVDEYGEPAPGTQVRAMRYVLQAGRRTLRQSGGASADDRGMYRIYGLQPGEYLVAAVPRNTAPTWNAADVQPGLDSSGESVSRAAVADALIAGQLAARAKMLQAQAAQPEEQPAGYAPVYYPGTASPAQAAPIALGIGEERTSIDFQLLRVAVGRIEGVVVNATGHPAQNVQLRLVDAMQSVPGIDTMSARADAEGRFRIANVPPGNYRLIARANGAGPGTTISGDGATVGGRINAPRNPPVRLWGSVDVPVDGLNVTNVVVPLQQGLTVSGRIVFQGTTLQPPPDLTRMRVNVVPADATGQDMVQPVRGAVDASGKFTIASVVPGLYTLTASGAGTGWFLESSSVDGYDTVDFPFEVKPGTAVTGAVITFTDRGSQLSGTITDQHWRPAPEQTLILYPADERFWSPQSRRIKSARPATDGTFSFTAIPPGDYKLIALVDVEPGAWFDPGFLQRVDAASTPVTVAEGEKKVQNLRISGP